MAGVNPWKGADSLILKRLISMVLAGIFFIAAAAGDAAVVDQIHHPETEFSFPEDSRLLEVAFPKISECDAFMIRFGDETWLVDCATEKQAPAVLELLEKEHVDALDVILITHPHPDHAGGLERILDRYDTGRIMVCFDEDENEVMLEVVRLAKERDILLSHFYDEDEWTIGDVTVHAYLKSEEKDSVNNRSPLLRLQYGDGVMLLGSDLENLGLRHIASKVDPAMLKTDILKYPHHGKDPMIHEFWEKLDLKFTVITATHYHKNGTEDVRNKHWPYVVTNDGMVELLCDGSTWLVRMAPGQGELVIH